jgi:hypothetical protein
MADIVADSFGSFCLVLSRRTLAARAVPGAPLLPAGLPHTQCHQREHARTG